MNEKFIYEYQIILGIPAKVNNFIIPQTLVSPLKVNQGTNGVSPDGIVLGGGDYLDYNTIPPKFWSIDTYQQSPLQVVAEVQQAKEQGVPTKLEITNLDPEIIEQLTKDCLVIIRAGYKAPSGNFISTSVGLGREQFPDLFVGQIQRITTDTTDVDWVTSIDCSEGLTVKKNSRVSRTFPRNTTREGVIRQLLDMLKTQGVPTGNFQLPKQGTKERKTLESPFLSGYSCYGFLMEELEKICEACNLRTFMSVGKIYIEPSSATPNSVIPLPSLALAQSEEIVIVKPTNVKGQVDIIDGDSEPSPSNKNGEKGKTGLKLTTYLDGQIAIEKVMRLEGFKDNKDGEYRITSVNHTMDYRGGVWETSVTLQQL